MSLSTPSFEPAAYRKSIADMFGMLPREQQREFAERLSILPRHIHALASNGLIADPIPREPPAKAVRKSRG